MKIFALHFTMGKVHMGNKAGLEDSYCLHLSPFL
jgi:hypothetical protein